MSDKHSNQYGSKASEAVQQQAYFAYAPASEIHTFYLNRKRPDPKAGFYRDYSWDGIAQEVETVLVDRNDPLIDATLALWGENEETVRSIYLRWFPEGCEWPPKEGTAGHWVLHSLLSNRWHPLTQLRRHGRPITEMTFKENIERLRSGIPREENPPLLTDERLTIAFTDDSSSYIGAVCENPACLHFELDRFKSSNSFYRLLPSDSLARCIQSFARNKRFSRIRKDGYHGPDLDHSSVHEAFLDAIRIAPKDHFAAAVICSTLDYLPGRSTKGARIGDHAERAAAAWNFELSLEAEDDRHYWERQQIGDDLSPTERIRFHIWRLYPDDKKLTLNNEDKVRRLACYATAKIKKRVSADESASVMRLSNVPQYANRDGINFEFAAAYNRHIWADESEDGQAYASAVTLAGPSSGRLRSELSIITERIVYDAKLWNAEDDEHDAQVFADEEGEQSDLSLGYDKSLIEEMTSRIDQLQSTVMEKLAGWEKAVLMVIAAWVVITIWRSL